QPPADRGESSNTRSPSFSDSISGTFDDFDCRRKYRGCVERSTVACRPRHALIVRSGRSGQRTTTRHGWLGHQAFCPLRQLRLRDKSVDSYVDADVLLIRRFSLKEKMLGAGIEPA